MSRGWLRLLAAGAGVAHLLALLLGPEGPHLGRDVGLRVGVLALTAAYAWCLVRADRAERLWRAPMAGWLSCFALASLLGSFPGVLERPVLYWLTLGLYAACYPFAAASVVLAYRRAWRRPDVPAALDALVGVLAVGAVFTGVALPAATAAAGSATAPGLVLAFPIADFTVFALLVLSLAASGGRCSPSSLWFVVGVVCVGAADTSYGIAAASGSWSPGTPVDALWTVGVGCIALLGAVRPPTRDVGGARAGVVSLTVPLVGGVASLVVLVLASRLPLPVTSTSLAAAAIAVALARLALAYAHLATLGATRRLALTDELTGLANRRAFFAELSRRLAEEQPVAVLIIDLDGFKQVNDTLGHAAGDQVLRQCAGRLAGCVAALPTTDEAEPPLLARIGGDEFAVVHRSDRPGDDGLADRLAQAVQDGVLLEGHRLDVGASVGHAAVDRPGTSADELMAVADAAMYVRKRARARARPTPAVLSLPPH